MTPDPLAGFTPLTLTPNMDDAPWADVDLETVLHGRLERIGLLPRGTSKGRTSVALLVRLDDGRVVVAETTWRLFTSAARALAASPVVAGEGG